MKFHWPIMFLLTFSFLIVSCGSDNDDDDDRGTTPQAEEETPTNTTNVRTLNRYTCYSGDVNALTKAYEVRRESVDGNRRLMLYDCRGSETCTSVTELTQATVGTGDESGSCLNGANGFGLCVGDDLVTEDTSKGELLNVSTTSGEPLYCSTNIPMN